MLGWTSDAEHQQLLPKETIVENPEDQQLDWEESTEVAAAERERESRMSGRSFVAGPIAVAVAIFVVWLGFTGFVVVPPGELAVVVTLVSVLMLLF
jgi:DNA-binding IclR family transcriptional regulator